MKISKKQLDDVYYWSLSLCILTLVSSFSYGNVTRGSEGLHLKVNYKERKQNDTLVLSVANKYVDIYSLNTVKNINAVAGLDGTFEFLVPMDYPLAYWRLYKKENKNTELNLRSLSITFLCEKGDNIVLQLSNKPTATGVYSTYQFIGRGNEKYTCQSELYTFRPPKEAVKNGSTFNATSQFALKSKLDFIDEHSAEISANVINVLKAGVLFRDGLAVYIAFRDFLRRNEINSIRRVALIEKARDIFSSRGLMTLDSIAVASNPNSIKYFYYGLATESLIEFGKPDQMWIYNQIKQRFKGILKDELIAYQLVFEKFGNNATNIYKNAVKEVKSSHAKAMLQSVKNNYSEILFGNYSVTDSTGHPFNLTELKGKVILIDFYFTGCGACTKYFKDVLSIVEDEFKNTSNVAFVSISMDKSLNLWKQTLKSGMYTNKENLYNFYTGGMAENHPIIKTNNIIGGPTLILINSQYQVEKFNTSDLYNISTLREAIEKAK